MDPGFWKGRRVLITGHTGFKGSWLCLLLNALQARVTGYALEPPTKPSHFALARVGDLADSFIGDIRDIARLTAALEHARAEVVIHMAAQSVVLSSYDDPIETYATNVVGTASVLEAVRRAKRPCAFLNVTTDKCYQNNNWVWGYRETDELGGRDPYSNSKACAELVGMAFRESFFPQAEWREHGVGIASARAGNVIGGGDWTPFQLVPQAMASFARRERVKLRNPSSVRPWQHVLDCLAGYLTLAEAVVADGVRHAGAWNFGPSERESWSVASVVEAMARVWSIDDPWEQDGLPHGHEEPRLTLDVTKTQELLGWRAVLPVEQAIDWTARWYLRLGLGEGAREVSVEEVHRYLDKLAERRT